MTAASAAFSPVTPGAARDQHAAGVEHDDVRAPRRPAGCARTPRPPHRRRRSRPAAATGRDPATAQAPRSAASRTIAVPCWSSCMTGQSSASISRRSSSKQRGADDVLEVDRAEAGPQPHEGLDDLVDVRGVEHERDRVEPAERLEQGRLALHHRQRGARADVAETEHGGAVADHGDEAVRPRVAAGERAVGGDGPADLRDAGRVGDGEVAVVAQRARSARWRACPRRARRRSLRWSGAGSVAGRVASIVIGRHFLRCGGRGRCRAGRSPVHRRPRV